MMPINADLSLLADLFAKALLFLDRAAVQGQIAVILASLFVSGLVAKRVAMHYKGTSEEIDRGDVSFPMWKRYGLPFLSNILFPLIGIISLLVARQVWRLQGWFAGLLTLTLEIMVLYLIYRVTLGVLYALFPDEQIRRYHKRLFGPLFAIIVIGIVISQLADLGALGRLVMGTLYDNPVTLGALLLATIGLYFWITGAWALQDVSSHAIKTRTSADTSNVDAYLTLGRYTMILVGLLVVFSALNLNPATVAAILGGLAVGISFGLREIVSNFVSGIWLLIERSVRPGDLIEVDGVPGTVVELSMRATTIRTAENVLLIVPNQKLFTSTVKTYTRDDRSIRGLIIFRVSPGNDSDRVMKIMLEAAQQHELICEDPSPSVAFEDLTPTYAQYRLAYWVDDLSDRLKVSSAIRIAVRTRFEQEEIQFLPHTTVLTGGVEVID